MRVFVPMLLAAAALVTTSPAAHAVPQAQRSPPLASSRELLEVDVLGGAVEAGLYALPVGPDVPSVVNGVVSTGAADLKLRLNLKARAAGAAGLNAVDASLPWQDVRVRIENLSVSDAERVVEFGLVPTVGLTSGWSYSSHVVLPPAGVPRNPMGDRYRITVTTRPGPDVVIATPSLPASLAWRATQPWTLLDGEVRFGNPTVLPVGPAAQARAFVTARDTLYAQFLSQDNAAAVTTYQGQLRPLVQQAMDPTRYPAGQGYTAALLGDLDLSITRALQLQAMGDDCGPTRPAECQRILERLLARLFTYAALQRTQDAVLTLDAGAWDDAAVYALEALTEGSTAMETLCLAGPPATPALLDCALVAPLRAALLDGAAAVLAQDGAALVTLQRAVHAALLKRAAYDFSRFLWRAITTAEAAQFNVERAAARAGYATLAHQMTPADRAVADATLASRVPLDLTPADAADLVARIKTALVPALLTEPDVCSPTDFAGVQP